MSGERCIICGVFGTSTAKCCGRSPKHRIAQIKTEVLALEQEIEFLLDELYELENEDNDKEKS
jgi:phosphoribosyl-dephospho-CoA transferase